VFEQAVDGRVEYAPRVELVSDRDLASCGDDGAAFVVELVARLQAAEVGPSPMEASGHPEEIDPVGAGLPRHDGVVQVPAEP